MTDDSVTNDGSRTQGQADQNRDAVEHEGVTASADALTVEDSSEVVCELFRDNAGWMISRGVLAVAFGIASAFWPREQLASAAQLTVTVSTADYVIMGYIVLNAAAAVAQGFASPHLRMLLWGQAVVALPAIGVLFLADTSGQLRAGVCVWAILHGLIELWIFNGLRGVPHATDYLYSGGVFVLLGIIVAFGDDFGPLTIFGFTGAGALIAGVLGIIGGFARRQALKYGIELDEKSQPSDAEHG